MRKQFFTFLFLVVAAITAVAQVQLQAYVLVYGQSQYNSIASQGTTMSFSTTDDGYATCTLPFAMPFGSQTIASGSQIACSANGFIYLGESSASGSTSTANGHKLIQPFIGQNAHIGRLSNSRACYYFNPLDSTFTIEYIGLCRYSSPYGDINYQVVLRPSGNITIAFGSVSVATTTTMRCYLSINGTETVGLSGSWTSPTQTSSVTTMSGSTLPTNMEYTFYRVLGACPGPAAFHASYITSDSCILEWRELGTATSWVMEYADSMFVPGTYTGNILTPVDTFQVIDNLTPATTYYVYLHSDCGTDTSLNRRLSFTTRCLPVDHYDLPVTYGFEDMSSGRINTCWTLNAGTGGMPTASNTGARTGLYNLNLSASGQNWGYIASPLMDDPANTLQVSFYGRPQSTSYNGAFVVGTMSNPDQPSTFHPIDTVTPATGSVAWEYFEVDLTNAPSNDHYVAIHMSCTTSGAYNYGFIDDIKIDEIPTCRRITQPSVSNITQHSVDLAWNDPNNIGLYLIEYGPVGFAQGTGTFDMAYTTQHTLLGLSGSVNYGAYIYAMCGSDTSNGFYITFTTLCGEYMRSSMPVTYGFEDATASGSSGTINQCWTRHTDNSTAYPYPNSSYVHSGAYSLQFYGSTTPYYSLLALPPVADSVQDIAISFYMYTTSTSYALQVGVMRHPDSINSFVPLATVKPSQTSTWEELHVLFESYTDTGRYIAFRTPANATTYAYIDDITVELAPPCRMPVNLTATYARATNNIMVSWGAPTAGDPVTQYYIRYKESQATSWTLDSTYNTVYIIPNPTNLTSYTIEVTTDCNGQSSFIASTTVSTSACNIVCLGNITTPYTPICTSNSSTYTYSQQLYTSDQISSFGDTINGISFKVSSVAAAAARRNVKVWLGPTSWQSFTGNTPMPIDSLTLVYDSVWDIASGWSTIWLRQPYICDPTQNLVLAVCDSTGISGSISFYGELTELYYAYVNAGTSYVDPRNPAGSLVGRVNGIATTRFEASCRVYNCPPPIPAISSVAPTSVSLSWVPVGTESTWSVEYREGFSAPWTMAAPQVANTSYTVTGLLPGTQYDFRVTALCNGDEGHATIAAYTACAPQAIPFTEDFENNLVGSFSHPCWNYSGSQPTLTGLSGYRDGNLMRVYANTYVALPQMSVPLDSLQITLTVRTGAASKALVGYSPDLDFANHFVCVDTVSDPTETGTYNLVSFASAIGATGYIVFYSSTALANGNDLFYDNIEVNYIESCPSVTSLTASNVSTTSAQVSWVDLGSNSTSFIVEYDTTGFTPGTGSRVVATTNTTILNGLTPGTSYQFYVYAVCATYGDTARARNFGRFTTSCLPTQLSANDSLTEDFEGSVCPPDCWSVSVSPGNTITFSTSEHHGGSQSIQFSSYTSATTYDQYLVTPELQLAAPMEISFWSKAEEASTPESFRVGTSTTGTQNADFSWSAWDTATTTWQQFVYQLPAATKYVAIHYTTAASAGTYYLYVDDLSIHPATGCPQPVALSASTTDNSATLSWTASGNSYEVSVRLSGASSWPSATTVSGTTHNATGLTANTAYEWRVRQLCGSNVSNWATGTFTTQQGTPTPCDPPTSLSTTSVATVSAAVSWSGTGNFEVSYKAAFSSNWSSNTSVTGNSHTFTGLTAGTTYDWRVRHVCSASSTSDWMQSTFTTVQAGDPCQAPSEVSATNITSSSAAIVFNAPTTQSTWQLQVSGGRSIDTTVNSRTVLLSSLPPSTTFRVKVRAVCGDGDYSNWSNEISFTTEAATGSIDVASGADRMSVTVHPNPAISGSVVEVTIVGVDDDITIVLYDITGRKLRSASQTCNAGCAKQFSLEALSRGTYFIRVQTSRRSSVRKLVIQ